MATTPCRLLPLALGALLGLAAPAAGGDDDWLTNLEDAKKKAKTEKKDILVDFTGSDWCGWCIRLKKEVFDLEAFKSWAKGNLILVELDFPRKQQPAEQKAYNRKLQTAFGVRGFPSIFLLDAEGRPFLKTGYRRGGADAYVKHLTEAGERKKEIAVLIEKTESSATDEAKLAAFDELFSKLREWELPSYGYEALEQGLIDLRVRLIEQDPDNGKGWRLKHAAALARHYMGKDQTSFDKYLTIVKEHDPRQANDLEVQVGLTKVEKLMRKDPATAAKKLEELLARKPSGEALQKVHYLTGAIKYRQGDKTAAKDHLEKALAAAPDSKLGKEIKKVLARAFDGGR